MHRLFTLCLILCTGMAGAGTNLLSNAGFVRRDAATGLPADWTIPRTEDTLAIIDEDGRPSLRVTVKGASRTQGQVLQRVRVASNHVYRLRADLRSSRDGIGFMQVKLLQGGREVERVSSDRSRTATATVERTVFTGDATTAEVICRWVREGDRGDVASFAGLSFEDLGGKQPVPPSVAGIVVTTTFESAGVQVAYAGEPRSGLRGVVRYRQAGEEAWREGPALIHVPAERCLRGSLLGLSPGLDYEGACELHDAAGATLARNTFAFRTWSEDPPVGRTIRLPAGVLTNALAISDKGAADAWVLYAGDAKSPSIIDVGQTAAQAVLLDGAQHVIFENVTVRGGRAQAFLVRDSHHVRIRRCDIAGWGDPGQAVPDAPKGLYFDAAGRLINYQAGIHVGPGCAQVVIESNFIHSPRGTANSWLHGHPAGPQGVILNGTDGNHVVRDNDIIGSASHWWNDAIESLQNRNVDGGPHRDTDICGNVLAFANDDCAELDGGQINVRFWNNWSHWTFCGVSCAPNRAGPSYVFRNLFVLTGDERGKANFGFKMGGDEFAHPGLSLLAHNTVISENAGLSTGHYGKGATPIWARNNAYLARQIRLTGDSAAYDLDFDLLPPGLLAEPYTNQERHATVALPRFADSDRADFRLKPGSPGIDRAEFLAGWPQPVAGAAPDPGAFEHGLADPLFPVRRGGLSALPLLLTAEATPGAASVAGSIALRAPAALGSRWRAHTNACWLAAVPAEGPCDSGAQTIAMTADCRGLAPGQHRAAVTFRTDGGHLRTVLVSLRVRHPQPFRVQLEAEDAAAAGAFVAGESAGASGRHFMWQPYDPQQRRIFGDPTASGGQLTFAFDVPRDDVYWIHGRVEVGDPDAGLRDSFYASLDDGEPGQWALYRTGNGRWSWQALGDGRRDFGQGVHLAAGPHRLRILLREAGACLDAIAIANEPGSVPREDPGEQP